LSARDAGERERRLMGLRGKVLENMGGCAPQAGNGRD
jgi:hypothetical protein